MKLKLWNKKYHVIIYLNIELNEWKMNKEHLMEERMI